MRVTLAASAGGYVAGEETAVLAHLEGRPPRPRLTPPLPAHRGYRRRPTLVQNVETLAHLALVARHGAGWFREAGTPDRPGTTLVTISGAVREPGVYELEPGVALRDLIDLAGGATSRCARCWSAATSAPGWRRVATCRSTTRRCARAAPRSAPACSSRWASPPARSRKPPG